MPSTKSKARKDEVVIFVDGASRGNPGLAGAGAIIKDSDGAVIGELRRFLGMATNNIAEYEALILALEEAQSLGCSSVSVFADSELVVKQIKGIYRVKNEGLKGLYAIATKLITQFSSFKISHVRRELNSEADRLANEAIDQRDKA
ncbi:MAG: ribonuclease HI family protein [Proteobacteria bacterium]|nr:ribonuclease HI family protein [Pseudomonadota bacterium]